MCGGSGWSLVVICCEVERIFATEFTSGVLLVVNLHGVAPRKTSFLSTMSRRFSCKACFLLGVSLVRSSTSDSSTSRSSRSDRHMFAVIVGACRWMPTCLRRCLGIFAGLKNPWSSGCMYLATTRRVVVLKSCNALRIDCGGRCVSVGNGGGVRVPPRRVKRANISSHEAPGLPGLACFQ